MNIKEKKFWLPWLQFSAFLYSAAAYIYSRHLKTLTLLWKHSLES